MLKGIFFVDSSNKNYSVAVLKDMLDKTKKAGLSGFCYHFSNGGTIQFGLNDPILKTEYGEYDLTPAYTLIKENGEQITYITEADVKEVMSYAKELGLEFIPSLDVPGHMSYILKYFPQFVFEGSADSINIKDPEAVAFALAFVDKYSSFFAPFECSYFGIGADEFAQKLNNEMGFETIYKNGDMQYFVDFMNKVIDCVASKGFEVMAWNDGICYNEDIETYGKIDNRLNVLYWMPGWGRRVASPKFLEDQGYRVINCYHTLYVPADPQHDTFEQKLEHLRNHRPDAMVDRKGMISESFAIKNPVGTFMCNWGQIDEDPAKCPEALWPYLEAFGEGYKSYK